MKSALKIRQEEENAKRLAFEASLQQKKPAAKSSKKMGADSLVCFLSSRGRFCFIRSMKEYRPASYNIERQLRDLVTHLYVKYRVPSFLYRCMYQLPPPKDAPQGGVAQVDRFVGNLSIYQNWFIAAAQGESIIKRVRGIMTAREAVLFLNGDSELSISDNVWLARARAAGLDKHFAKKLVERIFWRFNPMVPASSTVISLFVFLVKYYKEINRQDFVELCDFFWHSFGVENFSYRGRTLSSVIRLSNEYHVQVNQISKDQDGDGNWPGLGYPIWMHDDGSGIIWAIDEIRSSKRLFKEGSHQKHCVGSYVQNCICGHSYIFSMKYGQRIKIGQSDDGKPIYGMDEEIARITLEVNSARRIVQIRGKCNRSATADEMRVIRRWATERGLA